jgi:hypothetical protein
MRALAGPAAVVASLLVAGIAGAAPASAASFKPCSGSFQPNGTPGGGFYGKIKAKGVTCPTARTVTRAWVKRMASGATLPTAKVTVLGYTCRGKSGNNSLDVLCSRAGGTKAVKFHGQP